MTKLNLLNLSNLMTTLAYYSILSFCLFIYSSNAASSLGHIFLILPGFYFTFYGLKIGRLPKSSIFLFLFIVASVVSVLLAPDIKEPLKKIGELRYFLAGILSIWAFNSAFVKRIGSNRIRLLLLIVIIIASIASINGLIGLYTGFNPLRFKPSTDPNRATGLYSMAITFGYGVQFITLIIAGLFVFRKKVNNFISTKIILIGFTSTFLGLYFSGSRGALLGFLIGIPFFFLRTAKKKFISIFLSAVICLFVVFIIVFSGGSRSTRYLLPAQHDSNLIRISQYQAAYHAILERPLFGHGYRNFTDISIRIKEQYDLKFKDFISHAHNNYLEIFADTGLFGFMFFILFHIFWTIECFNRHDFVGDIGLALSVSFFVSGMFQCTITDAENAFAIMFIYGLTQIRADRINALKHLISL